MSYALWRADSPANVALFDSEADALLAVRRAVEAHGPEFVAGWSLIEAPAEGDWTTIAEGPDLAVGAGSLAHAPAKPPAASSARAPRLHDST